MVKELQHLYSPHACLRCEKPYPYSERYRDKKRPDPAPLLSSRWRLIGPVGSAWDAVAIARCISIALRLTDAGAVLTHAGRLRRGVPSVDHVTLRDRYVCDRVQVG